MTSSKLLTQLQEYSYGSDPIIQTPLFLQGVSASHILVRVHSEQVGSEAWPGPHVRPQTIENRKSKSWKWLYYRPCYILENNVAMHYDLFLNNIQTI